MTDCSCYQQYSRFEHGLSKGLSNQLNTFNNFQKLPCITYLIQDQKEWPNVLLPLPPSSQHFRPRMIKDEQIFFFLLQNIRPRGNEERWTLFFFFLFFLLTFTAKGEERNNYHPSFPFSISLFPHTSYYILSYIPHQANMFPTCFHPQHGRPLHIREGEFDMQVPFFFHMH